MVVAREREQTVGDEEHVAKSKARLDSTARREGEAA